MKKVSLKSISLSKFTIFIVFCGMTTQILWDAKWNVENEVIRSDVIHYYGYLPSIFIYKDLSLNYRYTYKGPLKFRIWCDHTEDGKHFFRYPVGLAVLYAPFFFMGHIAAQLLNYDAGGYSAPYKFFLLISCLFYVFIALLYLRKALLKYFDDNTVAITLLVILTGTNLYNYITNETSMSHAYSFAMVCIFIYFVDKWHEVPNIKYSLLTGLFAGLVGLIRHLNIVIAIVFILYNVNSIKALLYKTQFFVRQWKLILIIVSTVFVVFVPQFLYWHFVSGNWFFYQYEASGGNMFFNNPRIIDGLFGFRSGLLIYSPVLILAMMGFYFLPRYHKKASPGFLVGFVIFTWLILSWWCWWYGGGLGTRAFIDMYAILAFPLAASIAWILKHESKTVKTALLCVVFLLTALGWFHNRQYKKGLIHYDSMTKEAYYAIFGKLKRPPEYWDLLCTPDYELAKEGIFVCTYKSGKYHNLENKPQKGF